MFEDLNYVQWVRECAHFCVKIAFTYSPLLYCSINATPYLAFRVAICSPWTRLPVFIMGMLAGMQQLRRTNTDFRVIKVYFRPCSILNPFLIIRGLSCPSCIQASLCLKLTKPGFPHNCLPVSCGDIGFFKNILGLVLAWKSGLKEPFWTLGHSCPLQTILLSDLVGCGSPLQIVIAFWSTIIVSIGLSHPTQKVWIRTKRAPNYHYYQQRAVTADWMGSIALW